jgi:hypothetical protein
LSLKKIISSVLLLAASVNFLLAQIPTFQKVWHVGYGNTASFAVKTDAANNVYTTGYFSQAVDFDYGPGTYTLNGAWEDVFVYKTDADGNFIWAKQFTGKGRDAGLAMCLDPSGNIYVTGYFSDTTDFDPGPGTYTLVATDSADIFVCKLSPAGNLIWAKKFGGMNGEQGQGIALDASGNVYTTGFFRSTIDFDPGPGTFTLGTNGAGDIFVSKLDGNGNFIWAGSCGGVYEDEANSITVDASNTILLTGFFESNADGDPGPGNFPLTAVAYRDIVIIKINTGGNLIWAKNFGSLLDDIAYAITTDASGNVYTTGVFQGTGDFDPGPSNYSLTCNGGSGDIFISKLDVNGNFVWAKAFNSWYTNEGHAIYVDALNNVYTAGLYGNTTDFDPGPGTFYQSPLGPYLNVPDIYVSKLDGNGNFVWARTFGGGVSKDCRGLALDQNGNIYLTGFFGWYMDFDPGMNDCKIYTSAFGEDMYVNKLGPCLASPPAAVNTTSMQNLTICSGENATLTASGSVQGSLYWYTSNTSTAIAGSGTVFTTPALSAGTYTFYVLNTTCTISPTRTPITLTVSACIGIDEKEIANASYIVYPNPGTNDLYIKHKGQDTKKFNVRVFDNLGRFLISQINSSSIDISSLAEGIYYLRITDEDNNSHTTKFIKQ